MMSFFRALFQSWQQLTRQAWLWLATLVVVCLAFFAVNVLTVTNVLADRLLDIARERVDIAVSFKAGTPVAIVEQARTYLGELPETATVQVISADQALEVFRARYKQEESVMKALEEVGRNPFGATVIVRAKELNGYPVLSQALAVPVYEPWIQGQSMQDHREAIQELESLRRAVRLIGSLLLALFSSVALLLLVNVVRMAMFTQRDEILIMRLVGASKWRIRLPYAFSVLWVMIAAWGLMIGAGIALHTWLTPQALGWMQEGLQAIAAFFVVNGVALLSAQFVVAALVAMSIAWFAAGKYIKK